MDLQTYALPSDFVLLVTLIHWDLCFRVSGTCGITLRGLQNLNKDFKLSWCYACMDKDKTFAKHLKGDHVIMTLCVEGGRVLQQY